jgi:hypothetical protein
LIELWAISFWENCEPNEEQNVFLGEIESIIIASYQSPGQSTELPISSQTLTIQRAALPIYETFKSLTEAETICSSFLFKVDEILLVLDEISTSHEEITGRTNVLMMNCESLLEQQVRPCFLTTPSPPLLPFNLIHLDLSSLRFSSLLSTI